MNILFTLADIRLDSFRTLSSKNKVIKMKFIITLSALIAIVACVHAEQCTVNTDCTMTSCSTGYQVICEHSHEDGATTNGGFCVCAVSDIKCLVRLDCLAANINLPCREERKHCYDGNCICSRF
ncbi:hypothetical protein ACF0H5_022344 [Mactra antiquata]